MASEGERQDVLAIVREQAAREAVDLEHGYLGVGHLFMTLTRVRDGVTQTCLQQVGQDPRAVRHAVQARMSPDSGGGGGGQALPTERLGRVLQSVPQIASDDGAPAVGEKHLLLGVLRDVPNLAVVTLSELGVDVEQFIASVEDYSPATPDGPGGGSVLEQVGRDLTELARRGEIGEAIGRRSELLQMARTLSLRKKNNPLLIGDAGVGKTALAEGLAWRIAEGRVAGYPSLIGKRIVEINPGMLVAGTGLRGEFEERVTSLIEEARAARGQVILFIDELHLLIGAGQSHGSMDAAQLIKFALARGDFPCIGATTTDEFREFIEEDPALERRFQPITVQEPSAETTLEILHALKGDYEDHHRLRIPDEAIERVVELGGKLLPDRRFPDKAFDLLDLACARRGVESLSRADDEPRELLDSEAVAEVVSEWTGVPVTTLTTDERERLLDLEQWLNERVIGQERAVEVVSQAVRRSRAGVSDPKRPIGVFLFAGPTGVGKTELARRLAEHLFLSEDNMLRLDMSEFMERHAVARLVGAPPGYVGYEGGEGQLTGPLRRKPYSVVLIDEVEKAHPDVWNIFLQLFEDGRLTDSHGRVATGRHAVFVLTSNAGTDRFLAEDVAAGQIEDIEGPVIEGLRDHFRPELLNRLDEIVVFRPLAEEQLLDIIRLMANDLLERLADQQIDVQISDEALALIVEQSHDPAYGARPLRRGLRRLVENPLSDLLLEQDIDGPAAVAVTVQEGDIHFDVSSAPVGADAEDAGSEGQHQGGDSDGDND